MDLGAAVMDLFEGYRNLQETRPVLGSLLTAELVYPLAEGIAGLVKDGKIDPKKIYYKTALAPLYGLCIYGLMQTGEWVGDNISSNPIAMGALGPNLIGNAFNALFFVNDSVGEKTGYSIRELLKFHIGFFNKTEPGGFWKNFREKISANLSGKDYLIATGVTLTVWNAIQAVNYGVIPEAMRTPFALGCLLLWTPVLSYLSLMGRRKKAGRREKL